MGEIGISSEWGMYVNGLPQGDLASYGYAHFSVTSGAVVDLLDTPAHGAALPTDANCAYIVVEGAPVRWLVGTDPTTTLGIKWFADTPHPYENQRSFLAGLRMIAISTTADVWILWGRV